MVFLMMLTGMFLGSVVFTFTFISAKRNGKWHLAPIITFLMALGITAYGLFFVGGFEGMAYGFLALGFLIVSIIGTLLLPLLIGKNPSQQLKKRDKISLAILPILFFLTIGLIIYSDKGYWIIDQGFTNGEQQGYLTSTIMEGRIEVVLMLGEEYLGKDIEVKKVNQRGPTEITVEIIEGDHQNQAPFVKIGLDEINEPLKIQTTDGVTFDHVMAEKEIGE